MPYQPLYQWHRTSLDENDPPTDEDWLGYDGDVIIGRIRLEHGGPKDGQWQWAGHGPEVRQRHTPHVGYQPEGREAMRKVEEYYHALCRNNGMRGSKDV